MITQYPNTLIVPGIAGDAVRDENGAILKPASVPPLTYECRYEPSNVGKQFKTTDGNVILSKGVVYLPPETPFIQLGTKVEIPGYFSSIVLETYKGELHCKLSV